MFRKSIAAAVLVAGAALAPAAAHAVSGYTTERTELLAGPDYDYPVIRPIGHDRRVEIFGCLNDWSFCDVGYRSDRGWIDGRDIVVDYRSRRVGLYDAGPYVGIGFLSFSFGNYWDNHYRGRPFYRERGRWERHYHDHYRASWGPRRDRNWHDHRGNDRRNVNDRDRDRDRNRIDNRRDDDRRDNDRRGDNTRRDNDRRDKDRREGSNTPSYRGAPGKPAAVAPAPTPQPRPGITERDQRPGVNERNDRGNWGRENDRGNRDGDRANRREEKRTPQATAVPQPRPSAPAASDHRSNRGDRGMGRPDRSERPAAERPATRPDTAAQRSERPRDGQRENRESRQNRDKRDEERPGR